MHARYACDDRFAKMQFERNRLNRLARQMRTTCDIEHANTLYMQQTPWLRDRYNMRTQQHTAVRIIRVWIVEDA